MDHKYMDKMIAEMSATLVFSDMGFMADALQDGVENEEQLVQLVLENPDGINQAFQLFANWGDDEIQDYMNEHDFRDHEQDYVWSQINQYR